MTRRLIAIALGAVIVSGALTAGPETAHADLLELKWAVEGYYRTRAVYLTNLSRSPRSIAEPFPGERVVIPEIKHTSYLTHRLRLAPSVSFANIASLHFQLDALDDVLYGDNNGIASSPLFATDGSNQHFLGGAREPQRQGQVKLNKAWVEFQIPVGLMRVGRMPSNWGLGLLANGGGSFNMDPDPTRPKGVPQRKSLDSFFNDDFGDNHFGSVADRILFITKPLSIYRTATKAKDTSSKLVMGYAYDKLSEAPFLRDEGLDRTFRPFGQQGFISRGSSDDATEHVGLIVYNDPFWSPGGPFARYTDELRFGTYVVRRTAKEGSTRPSDGALEPTMLDPNEICGDFEGQPVPCIDTGSDVYIFDLWYRLRYGPFYSEGEVLTIRGETFGGIPFPTPNRKKKAAINGGVLRLGYFGTDALGQDLYDATLELGHASGDDDLGDEEFKQRALHPDFNVGLILFEEVLRELSARTYGLPFISNENVDGATGFFSNGGVINSNYAFLKGGYHLPISGMRLVGGVLAAWVDTPAVGGVAMFVEGDGDYLGTEFDLALKSSFSGKMDLSIETGYLRYGSALKSVFPNAKQSFSFQTRIAFVF